MRLINTKSIALGLVAVIVIIGTVVFLNSQKRQPKENGAENPAPLQNEPSTSPTTTSQTKIYRNEEWGFEFEYPSDWIIEDDKSYSPFSKFTRIGAPTDKSYLIFYPSPPLVINIVTPDFVERQFSDLNDIASETNVGGVHGLKYEYEFEDTSETTIILPIGQYKIILGANEEYDNVFNQILSSFKFLPNTETKTYRNEEWGFEFEYPERWTFHEDTFYSPFSKFNLMGASPEENNLPDPITPSIVVNMVKPDFVDNSTISFKNLGASTSTTVIAGVKVIKYEYEFENLPRIAVVGLSIRTYRILFGASKKYEAVFNKIIESFKFLE